MIEFACENCGKKFKVAEEHAGKRTKCPACENALTIPAAGQSVFVNDPFGQPPAPSSPKPSTRAHRQPPGRTAARHPATGQVVPVATPVASAVNIAGTGGFKLTRKTAVYFGVGLVVVVAVLFGMKSCWSGVSEAMNDPKIGALTYAQMVVKRHLKSPSTADFGGWRQTADNCVTDLGKNKYLVEGWVDSENSFGATVRTSFSVKVEHAGDDMWRVIEGPTMKAR